MGRARWGGDRRAGVERGQTERRGVYWCRWVRRWIGDRGGREWLEGVESG